MDFSDTSSIFSNSSATFAEEDFQLPDLEINTSYDLELFKTQQRQQQRINTLKKNIHQQKYLLRKVDRLPKIPDEFFLKKKGAKARPERLAMLRCKHRSQTELAVLKNIFGTKPGNHESLLTVLQEIANDTYEGDDADDYEESTIEHPKLGSVEEKLEDVRQTEIEDWCRKRGKKPKYRYSNAEKRMLRKWFKALDNDGSGEVDVEELQDPLLSSGIFKTREQVVRVLANVDKNNTLGIDFEEFLLALGSNKLADNSKLKRLQEMSSNPDFETDTLLTYERRNKLIKSILQRCEERQVAIDRLYKKYDKPKLSRREREAFEIERERLEEEQSRSIYLHLKYIHALELVIQDRKEMYQQQDLEGIQEEEEEEVAETTEPKLSSRLTPLVTQKVAPTPTRLKSNSDFYHSISAVRMQSSNRTEALATLRALVPLNEASTSSHYSPMSSLFGELEGGKSSSTTLATPMLGSTYLNSLKPIKKNSVEELRLNPYKIYAPYSPTIKKLNTKELRARSASVGSSFSNSSP